MRDYKLQLQLAGYYCCPVTSFFCPDTDVEDSHPKTPSSTHLRGQSAAQNKTKACRYAKAADNEGNIERALLQ